MGTVKKMRGLIIKLRAEDHLPPHVHILGPGFDCSVSLNPVELTHGPVNREIKVALKWIAENQTELLKLWETLNG